MADNIIEIAKNVDDLDQLIRELEDIRDSYGDGSVIYPLNEDGSPVSLELIVHNLTDGSVTRDVRFI